MVSSIELLLPDLFLITFVRRHYIIIVAKDYLMCKKYVHWCIKCILFIQKIITARIILLCAKRERERERGKIPVNKLSLRVTQTCEKVNQRKVHNLKMGKNGEIKGNGT